MSGESGNGSGSRRVLEIERRLDGVAVVRMDVPGETMNTLQANFSAEFAQVFDELDQSSEVRAVVFTSGKRDSFIAGADVRMIKAVKTAAEAAELSRAGQRAMARVASFRVPVVAAIHGACLGGGLETALACHARIATDDKKTKLGLPEVQLGLLPAAAGTQRLPRLIGVQAALDLMLTGKPVDGRRAKAIGLVDDVVPLPVLLEVACRHALSLADRGRPEPTGFARFQSIFSKRELTELALAENPLGRKVLFDQARKQLLAKTRGNYPAAERILDVVKAGFEAGFERGLEAEALAFGELATSPEAAQLMYLFTATVELKKDRGVEDATVEPRPVHKVGMLGAGLMGAGIAYVTSSLAKVPVRLKDKGDQGLAAGLKYVAGILDERVKKKRMTRLERDRLFFQITPTVDYSGFRDAELVIEAVFEDLALKHQMVRDIEAHGHEKAIFASNTSSLPITQIAAGAKHPARVIGMHYFSPVHKMPLLEIIVTPKTAPWVTATCVELGKKQGKTVIVVNDGVGFYTSRILAPYMNEAAWLLSEGVPVEELDGALVDWGYPVGPVTLLDEVGIDVGEKVGKIMLGAFGDRMVPPPGMDKLVADQRFGRKNARGFYLYGDKKQAKKKLVDASAYAVLGVTPKPGATPKHEIAERCALAMVNEAALCFGEGVLRSARDGDIGAIFGLGFPPFRGGPFRYVDAVGALDVVRRLERYEKQHGKRFTPAPVLVEMAQGGGTFHGERAVAVGGRGPGKGAARARV
ncbi:MAG: fatty acid oxidation complex subunit alpha FadJ [Polyangiaceae bacterium]|nr:fatty acid oxidation complex subunit alpha FadJ [Polyangiaceae bacterium]